MDGENTSGIERRKLEHISINLDQDVAGKGVSNGFERYQLEHQALPEIDLAQVKLDGELFGRRLAAPLLISSMTGGVPRAREINRNLALTAQRMGLAMGLGSQRLALEKPEFAEFYRVRDAAPDILLFANLGAVQLNYGYGVAECVRAVEMVGADALFLHLNPLQEAVMAEGDTNFAGLAARIGEVCRSLAVPVVVKEVGWGISAASARMLVTAGVAAIDVSGTGGTSWSEVERFRAATPGQRRVASAFAGWGLSTAESLIAIRQAIPDIPVFASGGMRTGLDVATALGLGAVLAGMASPVLRAAVQSAYAVEDELSAVLAELRIAMFCTGSATLADLRRPGCVRPAREPQGAGR
jgi:isopentenyl-diphosphate delta-isomerase